MGFFSFTCAKTYLPIMASRSWGGSPECYEVVLLYAHGTRLQGSYDGYGRVHPPSGGVVEDVAYLLEEKQAKLVLTKFCTPEDTFKSVGENHDETGQGHFHDFDKVERWYAKGGFKNYSSYKKAMH
jgi:hypothetical protein